MSTTPVAVFTYNRPRHTERMFQSLSRCERLDECGIHVFCDGAAEGDPAVEASRRVVRQWAPRLQAEVVERRTRLGLARSIVDGVTDLCRRHGRVIVVEDDLVLHESFVDYLLQALDRYETAPEVYQVSGYMFPIDFSVASDAVFLPVTTTWGWATWKRAWDIFDWHPPEAEEQLAQESVRRRFDVEGSYPYSEMLRDRLAGRNDSWGILWWWAVSRVGGLVLHPVRSLVWNGGFDDSGVHCGSARDFDQRPLQSVARTPGAIRFPERIAADERAFARYRDFLRNRMRPRGWRAVTDYLRRWLR